MSTASLSLPSLPSDFIKYSIENEVRIFIMMIFFPRVSNLALICITDFSKLQSQDPILNKNVLHKC